MTKYLILGAGFGGLTAAIELRRRLPDAPVTLVDESPSFVMGLGHVWAMDGRRDIAAGRRPIERLRDRGVEVIQARIEGMDVEKRLVKVGGRGLPYDRLLIGLGARLVPQAVPGFEHAHNLYRADAMPGLRQALEDFRGGRLLFMVSAMPFKCPAAPYEAAMVASDLLERRGVDAEIELTTPEPRPLPAAPAGCGSDIQKFLAGRRIAYAADHKPVKVDGQRREVHYANGTKKPYDLLVGVPPHQGPPVLAASGLADASGWVPVDPRSLATKAPGVHAVGDVTFIKLAHGKPLPKAGVFAEGQARVVVENWAAEAEGRPGTAAFDGHGQCYVELGGGVATAVEGDFYATPEPHVTIRMPTAETLEEKRRFETERLKAWFGG